MSEKGIQTQLKTPSIVVVDDHRVFRKSLVHRLKRIFSHSVVAEAKNGMEFLELLKNNTYDLVLMDVKMPEMDGIEATTRAIRAYPRLKVLALSMYDDLEFSSAMKAAGASGYILKGGDQKEMKNAIFHILRGGQYFSIKHIKA
ncbi:MAG: hypothetical protein DRI69_09025 [Bacteroidetes bacterium]|nr:MAG: hypothetical protein DRI69_09025 [Bacteroidota bacterium]